MPKQKKVKVLLAITKANMGGAQKYILDLATHLPKTDYTCVVAAGVEGSNGQLFTALKHDRIKTILIKDQGREIALTKDVFAIFSFKKILQEERPAIIHLNSSKMGFIGTMAVVLLRVQYYLCSIPVVKSLSENRYYPKRLIFTAHNWGFNDMGRKDWEKIVFYIGHYFTLLFCDVAIAVSEKCRRDILFLPFIKNKITIIYNGIDSKFREPRESALDVLSNPILNKARLKIQSVRAANPDAKFLYSMSELHRNKGIDLALRAIDRLEESERVKVHYFIAGDGEERASLLTMRDSLRLKPTVTFLGYVPDAKMLIPETDVLLLPSRTEAFPYAILEAGLVGVPIIATSVGGIPEIITDMKNGILVHSRNTRELSSAILYILNHPKEKERMAEKIKKDVQTKFNIEQMLDATMRIYADLP